MKDKILTAIQKYNLQVKPFTYGFLAGNRIVTSWIAGYVETGYNSDYVGATMQEAIQKVIFNNQ